MAILWEQLKMLRELEKLEEEYVNQDNLSEEGRRNLAMLTYRTTRGAAFVPENELILYMLKLEGLQDSDFHACSQLRKVLNACIEDKFINWEINEQLVYPENGPPIGDPHDSSPRFIQVSDNKGSELLNRWYFWLKYFPQALPPIGQVFIQIAIGVAAAIVTVLITKH